MGKRAMRRTAEARLVGTNNFVSLCYLCYVLVTGKGWALGLMLGR